MTEQDLKNEFERIVEEEYPLIASKYIDKEIMLREAQDINYEVTEWRGVRFPYKNLHKKLKGLVASQFLTTDMWDIRYKIGEEKVMGFLNDYFHWYYEEKDEQEKALKNNDFALTEDDIRDFEKFTTERPVPCNEPLDIAGYLHMLRIGYDAAPMFVYPDFLSDLHVVASAKFDSCGLYRADHSRKMGAGDQYPEFMYYHPEEMGFGGPYVCFEWSEEGWVMNFTGKGDGAGEREVNMDIHRFLAMRRAGYPVTYDKEE